MPSLIALLGAGGLVAIDFSGPDASMGFFGVGALLLTGGILYSGAAWRPMRPKSEYGEMQRT